MKQLIRNRTKKNLDSLVVIVIELALLAPWQMTISLF